MIGKVISYEHWIYKESTPTCCTSGTPKEMRQPLALAYAQSCVVISDNCTMREPNLENCGRRNVCATNLSRVSSTTRNTYYCMLQRIRRQSVAKCTARSRWCVVQDSVTGAFRRRMRRETSLLCHSRIRYTRKSVTSFFDSFEILTLLSHTNTKNLENRTRQAHSTPSPNTHAKVELPHTHVHVQVFV